MLAISYKPSLQCYASQGFNVEKLFILFFQEADDLAYLSVSGDGLKEQLVKMNVYKVSFQVGFFKIYQTYTRVLAIHKYCNFCIASFHTEGIFQKEIDI